MSHPSEDYPEPDCYCLSNKMNATIYEKERDNCAEGNCLTGCAFGLLARVIAPASDIYQIIVGAVMIPIEIVSGVLLLPCCCMGLVCFCGACHTAEIMVTNALLIPGNILCPEAVGALGFYEWDAKRATARNEHRKEQKFGFSM